MDPFLLICSEIVSTLLDMAPYLIFGFAVAGFLSVFISQEQVEGHLGGHGLWPVIKASLIGVPLPLCSCGVIPVTAAIRKHGASRGAALSFLLSTPQTGIDSIAVTYSLLGPVFAVFRPVAAFITGIIGGVAVNLLEKPEPGRKIDSGPCADECCATGKGTSSLVRAVKYAFAVLPRDIAKPLILGLVAAGLIGVVVPDDFFHQYVGEGIWSMIVMMLAGIPMYVCATASVPIALAMMLKGLSPGAAMVFLMTGPATNAASIAMVWKMFGRRTTFIYLAVVAGTALLSGLALDSFFNIANVHEVVSAGHLEIPGAVNTVSALFLLVILAAGILKPAGKNNSAAGGMDLIVTGMTCSHCEESVRKALAGVRGVRSVKVSVDSGIAEIEGDDVEEAALIRAVQEAGYEAEIRKEEGK